MRYLSGKPTIEYAQAIWNFLHFPFGDTKSPLKTKCWVCICINKGSFTTLKAQWALLLYRPSAALKNFVLLARNYSPKSAIAIRSRRVKLPLFRNLRTWIVVFRGLFWYILTGSKRNFRLGIHSMAGLVVSYPGFLLSMYTRNFKIRKQYECTKLHIVNKRAGGGKEKHKQTYIQRTT